MASFFEKQMELCLFCANLAGSNTKECGMGL